MKVVSILAHQDDEMRCLGTMLKCRERGDTLGFITLTDGCNGLVHQPDLNRGEAAAIRQREMQALADELNAPYINLGEEDEYLFDTRELRVRLAEAIRCLRPDLVFTHFHSDYNQDHVTTHDLTRHCLLQATLPTLVTDSPPLEAMPAVFVVPPHGPSEFQPTHFVDVTPFEERKIELMKHHASQQVAMRQAVGSDLDALCRRPDTYWGDVVGCGYAEAFAGLLSRGMVKPYPVLP